jgi:hypothetical protein
MKQILEDCVSQKSSRAQLFDSAAVTKHGSSGSTDSVGLWTVLPGILHHQLADLALNCPCLAMHILHIMCKALGCSPMFSATERYACSFQRLNEDNRRFRT